MSAVVYGHPCIAYNATPGDAPPDQEEVWTVVKVQGETLMDWEYIHGLTRGYAQALVAAENAR